MRFDRIILCTDAPKGKGLANYYFRAFSDLIGEETVFIIDEEDRNYGASLFFRGLRRVKHAIGLLAQKKYSRIIATLAPGQNIVILFNNADFTASDIQRLANNPSVYLVNYLSDHPYGIISSRQNDILRSIPFFDMICTFAADIIPVLYQLGAKRVKRIPFGYCKYTHFEPTKAILMEYSDNVYYFGTWSEEIEEWVKPLLVFNLHIEGHSWEKAHDARLRAIAARKIPKTDHNMAILARKAAVVVNFTRARHGCFHTMKTFELTAAGACVVTNFSIEQKEFFEGNNSIMYFNTTEEMIVSVTRVLSDLELQKKLRDNARETALPHSYHARATEFISAIKAM